MRRFIDFGKWSFWHIRAAIARVQITQLQRMLTWFRLCLQLNGDSLLS